MIPRLKAFAAGNTMLLILIGILVLGAVVSKGISIQPSNIINVLFQTSIIGVVAIGQTICILTGGIDLTVGGVVILTAIIMGGTTTRHTTSVIPHIGLLPGMIFAVCVAVVIGLVNGLIISRTRIPPFIVTLAMLNVVIGLAFLVTRGIPVYDHSDFFAEFGRMKIGPVTYPIILWIGLMILAQLFLSRTRYGKKIYAIGGSEKAAFLSGIKVSNVKLLVYGLSGFMAGIGGFLYIVRTYMLIPTANAGAEYLMNPIAAVVVGGVSLTGGRGSMKDTFIGVLIIAFLNNLMNIMLIPPSFQMAVTWSIILVGVIGHINITRQSR
jgi:ribose/xylose/arabinose/galactoside ABC-type transport system permease subunit